MRLAACLCALTLALPAAAAAKGGPTEDPSLDSLSAGRPTEVEFLMPPVAQPVLHLQEWVGGRPGSRKEKFVLRPTSRHGHWKATVTIPGGGWWQPEVWDGDNLISTDPPFRIEGPRAVAPAAGGSGPPPWLISAVVALVVAAALLAARRTREAASGET